MIHLIKKQAGGYNLLSFTRIGWLRLAIHFSIHFSIIFHHFTLTRCSFCRCFN